MRDLLRTGAGAVLVVLIMFIGSLGLWVGTPLVWLWIGSQVDYWTGSVFVGIVVAFAGVVATLFITLALATRVDRWWRLLRRAAGFDQRSGALARIFGATAIVALAAFGIWFLIIHGPGPQPA